MLLFAKAGAEVAERLNLPVVLAEIVAGLIVGPSVLGWVRPGGSDVLPVLGELGVILLLLDVGMEMDLADLGAVGRSALLVAVAGVCLPMALGVGAMVGLGHPWETAIFMGAALTATSVGITARVFGDLRALTSAEARTVLGAAVADDVLGLILLTVVVRVVSEGSVSIASLASVVGAATGFLVVVGAVALRVTPGLVGAIHRHARGPGTLVALAFAFTLALSELAELARLAPIIGAFLAGLAMARSDAAPRIRRELTPVGHLLIPVFFLQIGLDADLASMVRPGALGLAGVLLVVAVAGKVVSPWLAPGLRGDRLLVGLGMLPRGEVGLIFAGLGLRSGVLSADLYAALILVVLLTTVAAPPAIRSRLLRLQPRAGPALDRPEEPLGGWVASRAAEIALNGHPPATELLTVALSAAALAVDHHPSPELLDWFAAVPADVPVTWTERDRVALLSLLGRGNARSWRLLEALGVLDRALPEMAGAVRRRRADPNEVDPSGVLRWPLVEALHAHRVGERAKLEHPEWLELAALVLDVTSSGGPSPVDVAEPLVRRLQLGAEGEREVALLVGDSGLLLAAAARADGLSRGPISHLASHLATPERARALYVLTLALNGLEDWELERLRLLHDLVQTELAAGTDLDLVERRRAEATALANTPAVVERLAAAPGPWVLSHGPEALVRQASLLAVPPRPGTARVSVTSEGGTVRIDVAVRDRPGALAATAGALSRFGLDVVSADIGTWGDGVGVQSFAVRGPAPQPAAVEGEVRAALRAPSDTPPVDALVTFDDDASPWSTVCTVEAADQPGLLHAVTAAIAAAGADVHSARASSVAGTAHDVFELTDRRGAKLSVDRKAAVTAAIASGVHHRLGRAVVRSASARRHKVETPG